MLINHLLDHSVKSKRENTEGRVTEAESFFIDALEEWRVKQGIEKMALVGHSLGTSSISQYIHVCR